MSAGSSSPIVRPIRLAVGALVLSSIVCRAGDASPSSTMMWYDKPGTVFTDGLPLGNGRMGFMVQGNPSEERIVLNEESMWSGSADDSDRAEAHHVLPKIRELLLAGRNIEAQELVNQSFTCQGKGSGRGKGANVPFGCYQTLGFLKVKDGGKGEVSGYRRQLDLSNAVATVTFRRDGVTFTREHFVSAPDQLGVIRFRADQPGRLDLEIGMDRPERFETRMDGGDLLMTGTLPDGKGGHGVSYAARVRVVNKGGEVKAEGNSLRVHAADEVLLLVSAETDYHGNVPRERRVKDPVAESGSVVSEAEKKPFDRLLADHVAEYLSWFDRASLVLADGREASVGASELPTNERLVAFAKGGTDPALAALYFQYGRYLLISCSRPGTLPANLQGIWADQVQTPWNGDWHLNINVQMNYWPAEITGLGECHKPMLGLIESLQEPGSKTAKAYYNARGWVAHVITNPWGFTAPGEHARWGSTASGSAWLCSHFWEHYAFGGDKEYLARIYPVMKGAAEFYQDMLIEEPKNKWLVTAPSNSPENVFKAPDGKPVSTCMGPTIDMQILRELFGNCITASTILGVDEDLRADLQDKRKRLAPNQVGPDGRLQEWLEPYEEPEPHHRHVSHLYGLHPYDEICGDPKLMEAARKSLEFRGDDGTGWSLAWKINFWARLRDGNRAEKLLRGLLRPTGDMSEQYKGGGSGSYANLFCAHPPFQIDGNFGGTAGIAEMLVQSRWSGRSDDPAEITILPALPDAWPTGKVTGLRARGGCTVDVSWKQSALAEVSVVSRNGGTFKINHRGDVKAITLKPGEKVTLQPGDFKDGAAR